MIITSFVVGCFQPSNKEITIEKKELIKNETETESDKVLVSQEENIEYIDYIELRIERLLSRLISYMVHT